MTHIGVFITPHGFGHAARAVAVMDSIRFYRPDIHFDIFTQVPEFFFLETLPKDSFDYFKEKTDIGIIQKNPLEINIDATLHTLSQFIPFNKEQVARLAEIAKRRNLQFIICDIAPLGIAVASAAGIPSVLEENFTWDWIYSEYVESHPEFQPYINILHDLLNEVSLHIQTEPAFTKPHCPILVPPVARMARIPRETTRHSLGISPSEKMILITMGGIPASLDFLHQLEIHPDVRFVIPGSNEKKIMGNIIHLPYESGFYHPDLIEAADAVVGKPGYSTVAEVYQSGVPFAYVPRPRFRESAVLEAFMRETVPGFPVEQTDFESGAWLENVPRILSFSRMDRKGKSGARMIAEIILNHLLPKKKI